MLWEKTNKQTSKTTMLWEAHDVLRSCLGKRGRQDGRHNTSFSFSKTIPLSSVLNISLEEISSQRKTPIARGSVLRSTSGSLGGKWQQWYSFESCIKRTNHSGYTMSNDFFRVLRNPQTSWRFSKNAILNLNTF